MKEENENKIKELEDLESKIVDRLNSSMSVEKDIKARSFKSFSMGRNVASNKHNDNYDSSLRSSLVSINEAGKKPLNNLNSFA